MIGLLQRLHDVNAGQLLIDGHDIRQLTQASLTSAIAIVSQDVLLFHRSVLENVRYGRPGAPDDEVMDAIAAAGCSEFVHKLPDGVNTIVGDRGLKLSGGQRQRLAIARAFLCDAPVLLLDEATSALDSESEAAVQTALARLMRGRTVLAAAHRLSTLRDFDRIVLLEMGRIVQDGPPSHLARTAGPYRHLLRRQALDTLERAA
jgi:ATP-binding cassette subfamily B protein